MGGHAYWLELGPGSKPRISTRGTEAKCPSQRVNQSRKPDMEPGISTAETEARCSNWRVNQNCETEAELGIEAESLKPGTVTGWGRDWSRGWKKVGSGTGSKLKQGLEQGQAGMVHIEQLLICCGRPAYKQGC